MSDRKAAIREAAARPRTRKSHGLALLEDIGALTGHSQDLQETLDNIVNIVAEQMRTEVCSLYLFDPKDEQLTLSATTGLERAAVGKVKMRVDEGLTGMVIEKGEPVMVVDALAHPRYKYFPETGEERYHSFLGVPIAEKRSALGVLIVQTLRRRRFSPNELRVLRAIASQVRGIIVQARLLETLETKEKERQEYRKRMVDAIRRLHAYEKDDRKDVKTKRTTNQFRLTGAGASPGFGKGRAHLLRPEVSLDQVEERGTEHPDAECERLATAITQSIEEMIRLKEKMHVVAPEIDGAMFDAQRMMLEDATFASKIEARIRAGEAAETALKHVVEEYVEAFLAVSDAYLRERAADVRDIGQRVLRNLLGQEEQERGFASDVVLVAHELTLSDMSLMEHQRLKGIVLASGGVTSHASILAKSFEIPTVVGIGHIADVLHEGDMVIVDGNSGVVYVNPGVDVAREYQRLDREYRAFNLELEAIRDAPAETTDGARRVKLYANIGLVGDLHFVDLHGAEGVGLYRTELPFLSYKDFPGEQEQLDLYGTVIERMKGRVVTIRTLDVGADKYPSFLTAGQEENPFLGWRSIRVSLEMPAIFKAQLRAILRAGALGPTRMMFPMISSLEEIRRVKELLDEARQELDAAGEPFDRAMPIGIMIEVPAAVTLAPRLIEEVDFFSIGTNDLIQYLLAVDRNNSRVAPLYEPLHPAVLAAIADVAQAAHDAGKTVGMCGEMASDPLCTIALLGMGLDDLSMGPFFIPVVKRVIRSVPFTVAEETAREVRTLATAKEVKGFLFARLKELGIIELMDMYH